MVLDQPIHIDEYDDCDITVYPEKDEQGGFWTRQWRVDKGGQTIRPPLPERDKRFFTMIEARTDGVEAARAFIRS